MKKGVVFIILIGVFLLFSILFASTDFVDDESLVQNVTGCGILNTTNATYTLNQSINSSFDCLIINATDITLDCANYNITYGNATGGFGVYASLTDNQNNTYTVLGYNFGEGALQPNLKRTFFYIFETPKDASGLEFTVTEDNEHFKTIDLGI